MPGSESLSNNELHENEPRANPAWLGGFFDIGGSVWINRQPATRYASHNASYIFGLSYSENHKKIIDLLSAYLGGKEYERSGVNSFDWRFTGNKAFALALPMKDFSPSRQWVINTMQQINDYPDADKKELFLS
jgi:hypothetical protein